MEDLPVVYCSGKAALFLRRYNRYADDGDDDCKSMEADFTTILMEKKKSARIGKKGDEEEYAKIQEEERREKLREQAKMRKLSQR